MRIYLAATTSGMNKELRSHIVAKSKPKYILETFYAGEKKCLDALSVVDNDRFLLDSGAFSYMNGAKITLTEMDSYVDRYIDFIIRNNIKYYFEIDVDNIFGLNQVELWRNRMESKIGYQCIPVWHKGRGIEYWKKMCSEYDYVAIGGLVFHVKKQEYGLIKKMTQYAHHKGVKVHGLGFTKTRELSEYDFYSVDSATWIRAASLGSQIHFFKNGIIEMRPLDKNGFKTNISQLAAHNFTEWVKFQKYMDGVKK